MRLILKFKAAATLANVLSDVRDILVAKATNPSSLYVDGPASSVAGTYVPRFGLSANVLYMELANGAVVGLTPGTAHLTLRMYTSFNWATFTGTSDTVNIESTLGTVPLSRNNTANLAIATTTTICLNILPNSVSLTGVGAIGNTTAAVPNVSNAFRICYASPVDETRFDGITTVQGVVFSQQTSFADKRYGLTGSAPSVVTDVVINTFGFPAGGACSSSTGVSATHVNPIVALFPGGMIADANGELFILAGRRPLGEQFSNGSRTWACIFYGHAETSYSTDVWQASSIFAEQL